MQDFEKLGAFYLGRVVDAASGETGEQPLLYDAKDLTTHAMVVGMTGSGKTGLGIGLLEEAALDGVPSLVVDPKGDLGNLLLCFPELRAADFAPWVDPAEAARRGRTLEQLAADTAVQWKDGLAAWGQGRERIRRFRDAADVALYTPGSSAGMPLRVLRSFAAPSPEIRQDTDALAERVQGAVAGLLALLGVVADPVQSREHILLANLFTKAWKEGRDLDLGALIQAVQVPPFDRLGVLDLEDFFPRRDRQGLAMQLNALLASPTFESWMQGEPLDVQSLLYTAAGKPRISILSMAHLSDAERMFFVTILLSEVVSWMRSQPGTGSLRALLYMDEIFGFFPPTATPPAKPLMLTLLKQARAYGLGVVLATQNPVDLDYKGLANCGSWFIGRLQTERDKERLLAGLEGASTESGRKWDRRQLAATIGSLGKRVFLLNNVHEEEPVLFQTRWVLSYLSGPLSRDQITRLMAARKKAAEPPPPTRETVSETESSQPVARPQERPQPPADVTVRFLPLVAADGDGELLYRPALLGRAQLHFKRVSMKIDDWQQVHVQAPIPEQATRFDWLDARVLTAPPDTTAKGEAAGRYASLPPVALRARAYASASKSLAAFLYREQTLVLWRQKQLKLVSRFDESERDFRVRASQAAAEKRDLEVEKLKARYTTKMARLKGKIEKAEERLAREQSQYRDRKMQTAISFGTTLVGALLGRKLTSSRNVGRATTAMRDVGRSRREQDDVVRARENLAELREELAQADVSFTADLAELRASAAGRDVEIEKVEIRPLKSDVAVDQVLLLWTPWRLSRSGTASAAWHE